MRRKPKVQRRFLRVRQYALRGSKAGAKIVVVAGLTQATNLAVQQAAKRSKRYKN
jgi:hypothetical protein